MERIVARGGRRLEGWVRIDGAKNAVLPIIAASLLAEGEVTIEDVPNLEDVRTICRVLECLGASNEYIDGSLTIDPRGIDRIEAPYEEVRRMRASFLVMGPLLAKFGRARMSLPGGCAIGTRPIDLHLKGFEALGAKVYIGHGFIEARAERLVSAPIYLDFPSVGATENIMMAATLAQGTTVLENAAEEPEIVDLANFLSAMGARIRGAGTRVIKVEGVSGLSGARYSVIPDRIEAGTYMVAAAITGGRVVVDNIVTDHLKPIMAKLREAGCEIRELAGGELEVIGPERPEPLDVKTLPHPGFPTDLQAPIMALLTLAEGTSVVTETVFENRFMHVDELKRMGAHIKIDGRSAVIRGTKQLTGAPVTATDLRAGAALVLAGLAADGETSVSGVSHLDRGYQDFVGKLRALGADIERREN